MAIFSIHSETEKKPRTFTIIDKIEWTTFHDSEKGLVAKVRDDEFENVIKELMFVATPEQRAAVRAYTRLMP